MTNTERAVSADEQFRQQERKTAKREAEMYTRNVQARAELGRKRKAVA